MSERRNKTSKQANLRTILIFPTSMSRKKLSLVIHAVLHSIMLLGESRLWYYSPTQGRLWRTVGKELFLMRINLSSISCLLYAEGDISQGTGLYHFMTYVWPGWGGHGSNKFGG